MSELWVPGQPRERTAASRQAEVEHALRLGREGAVDDPTIHEMRLNRRANLSKQGAPTTNVRFATGRVRDPMFYWKDNNLPYDVEKPEQLKELRTLCRTLYMTHPVIASAIDIFCLAAETRVVTRQGIREIGELAGATHEVLTERPGGGPARWVEAEINAYGEQPLRRVVLQRYGREKVIHATPGHRWIVRERSGRGYTSWNEVATDDLREGVELKSIRPRNEAGKTHPSSFGIAHGIVFGDGARESNGGSMVDLHGAKNMPLSVYFNGSTTHPYHFPNNAEPCLRVYGLPGYFKDRPSRDESAAYLYGWLAGYFAADGTVSRKGQVTLSSVKRDDLEFVRDICLRLGVGTNPIYDVGERESSFGHSHHMWMLAFDRTTLTESFFLIEEHRARWEAVGGRDRQLRRSDWKVVSVEETDRIEEVYCAKVPETEVFALEDELLTGNSKYPLTGMEFVCKDQELTEFYTTLFIDQLEYDEFLIDVGREFWSVGEAWPLGSFNEVLGVWEDDELVDPDDVEVIRSPFLREPRFEMRLPRVIREILENREPEWEFRQLTQSYPELVNYAWREDALMPVSNILLKQLKFKGNVFHPRGIPILLRGLRTIMQEEMLNAAQDAVASRLYTPLILSKLGASATELGTDNPWVPQPEDLSAFEEAVDAALAGDFRMLTYHFAVSMQSVFGRETMPRMDGDFDRLTDRILQVFGLSRTMLSGGERGQTYAADALNRDLITQLLSTYQRSLKRFVRDRAMVVAEAQEHYDYETRAGKRYPIMEEVLEVDEETGEQRIVEQPKLLVPDLNIRAMNMRDEDTYRQFIEALRSEGVPISMRTRLTNVPVDLDDEVERVREEQVEQAVEAQRTREETYKRLRDEGLPIPDDLKKDFEPKASDGPPQSASESVDEDQEIPTIGRTDPASTDALVPGLDDDPSQQNGEAPGGEVVQLPRNRMDQRQRPPESDEQRDGMPRPASLQEVTETFTKVAEVEDEDDETEGVSEEVSEEEIEVMRYLDGEGNEVEGRLTLGPRHVGRRRYAQIDKNQPLDEQIGGSA